MLSFSFCYSHTLPIICSVLKKKLTINLPIFEPTYLCITQYPFKHITFISSMILLTTNKRRKKLPPHTHKQYLQAEYYRQWLTRESFYLPKMRSLIGYPIQSVSPGIINYYHIALPDYICIYIDIHLCNDNKEKSAIKLRGVRRSIGVVSGRGHEKGWKDEKEGEE